MSWRCSWTVFIIKVTGTFHFGLITTTTRTRFAFHVRAFTQANNISQDEVGALHCGTRWPKRRDENKSNTCPIRLSSLFRNTKHSHSWGCYSDVNLSRRVVDGRMNPTYWLLILFVSSLAHHLNRRRLALKPPSASWNEEERSRMNFSEINETDLMCPQIIYRLILSFSPSDNGLSTTFNPIFANGQVRSDFRPWMDLLNCI